MEQFLSMQKKGGDERDKLADSHQAAPLVQPVTAKKRTISSVNKLGKIGFSLAGKKPKMIVSGVFTDDSSAASTVVVAPSVPSPSPVPERKKRRKNRWDTVGAAVSVPTVVASAGLSKDDAVAAAVAAAKAIAAAQLATQSAAPRIGGGLLPAVVDAEVAEQLRVQKEMMFLEQRVRQLQRANTLAVDEGATLARTLDLHSERIAAYEVLAEADDEIGDVPRDTAEDAEAGLLAAGSWEHRKRAKEMLATAESALSTTLAARAAAGGSRHLGNYLPKEEMDRFLARASAVSAGKDDPTAAAAAAAGQHAAHTLQQDNLGHRMLAQAGWQQGHGLGAQGQGVVVPVASGEDHGAHRAGLGAEKPGEVTAGDDEFSQYRKRMMMAYRFRPNPLNNPRRAYY